MIKSFFFSKKWRLWAWGGFLFIIGSLVAQTWIDVKINGWYKGFYDLLQEAAERDVSEFYDGIFLFMKFPPLDKKLSNIFLLNINGLMVCLDPSNTSPQ